ncbi:hypothetical protein [Arthrobacter sp. FB24]|uniref:hypothetical protein n=1 Tax=Arthrobacter sp. (strain FB24) TaxID=290399 RepID=UPI000693CE77|nr:hypothetical protein [Arthrobacter sp. FB24]
MPLQGCCNVGNIGLQEHDDPDADEVVELFESTFILESAIGGEPVQLSFDRAGILDPGLDGVMVEAVVAEPGTDGVPDGVRCRIQPGQQRTVLLQGAGYN